MNTTRRFYDRAKPLLKTARDLPDFFTYHLTVELDQPSTTVAAVRQCYAACDMAPPTWLPSHFSNGLIKPRIFIKANGGYRLENSRREQIAEKLSDGLPDAQTSAVLTKLEPLIPAGPKRDFLHETIKCFTAGANRAAIVMCWNLAAHHLQEHILADATRHAAFDAALAKNSDRRVKVTAINKQDDFTEMPEFKFLEFCREAKIINGTMFNKLSPKLNDRNGAAHPSGVTYSAKFAEAYIEDLVTNVLLKYAV